MNTAPEVAITFRLILAAGQMNTAAWERIAQEIEASKNAQLAGNIIFNLAKTAANSIRAQYPETWEATLKHGIRG
ncbi:hypothetical protein ACX80W_01735 [Arthrobacter sp. TMN-37]